MSRAAQQKISDSDLIALYESGLGSQLIARRTGLCASGIRQRLNRLGVKMRFPGTHHLKRPDVSTDDVVALYESGLSTPEVARRVGLTKRAVLQRLQSRHVKMRNPYTDYLHGKNHPRWKGGRTVGSQGYVFLNLREGRRLEHRVVMEKVLGRPLKRSEYVHHINGIRDDNRPENLIITHPTKHESRTLISALQRRIRYLEALLAEHQNPRGTASGTTPSAYE